MCSHRIRFTVTSCDGQSRRVAVSRSVCKHWRCKIKIWMCNCKRSSGDKLRLSARYDSASVLQHLALCAWGEATIALLWHNINHLTFKDCVNMYNWTILYIFLLIRKKVVLGFEMSCYLLSFICSVASWWGQYPDPEGGSNLFCCQ